MIIEFQLEARGYRADLGRPLHLSIPLRFDGPQPSHYGAEAATAEPMRAGGFVGDTRQGGSCNVPVLRLNPHCNGTHTESVGHIVDEPASVHEALRDCLTPAVLISVLPMPAEATPDTYRPAKRPDDLLIPGSALEAALCGYPDAELRAVVLRTLPNDEGKLARAYGAAGAPPFLSVEAIDYLNSRRVEHLLVDFPSLDRMHDEGRLTVHHRFWGVEEGTHRLTPEARALRTVTELIYAPPAIPDGLYLLNLQIAPFMLDVAPSRPILYALTKTPTGSRDEVPGGCRAEPCLPQFSGSPQTPSSPCPLPPKSGEGGSIANTIASLSPLPKSGEGQGVRVFEAGAVDPLARVREEFCIPRTASGEPEIYLCGNSLGLMPRRVEAYVAEFLDDWRRLGVKGHFEARHAWMPYHEYLTAGLAELVGALPLEVVAMNSLTVNLHLMLTSFYRPTPERFQILIEEHAFPSDTHAAAAQARLHGFDPADALLRLAPREGEELLREEDLHALLDAQGDSIALILLPGVQYYTGQALDLRGITEHGRAKGCAVGFDLAHAVGNLPLSLHDWGVDFACWCSYKYLNAGAGAVAGCFVHERHAHRPELPRLAGWWGHDKATRFRMGPDFQPIPGAEGWQLSNPPILSLAALRASLDVFREAGGMAPLREKSLRLTGYLEALLDAELGGAVEILTPREPERRGCQLSLKTPGGRRLHERLAEAGVVCDWREPNVLRAAPAPLYNSFSDVRLFVERLKGLL